MAKNKNVVRLIRDLSVTFNFTPLTPKEVASYWKRGLVQVEQASRILQKYDIAKINAKGEIALTDAYKTYFRKNPDLALAVARNTF
jgi:hypothetical protein